VLPKIRSVPCSPVLRDGCVFAGTVSSIQNARARRDISIQILIHNQVQHLCRTVGISGPNGRHGTAIDGSDYLLSNGPTGTVSFLAGETTKTIDVMMIDDAVAELEATFVINPSAPTNATIADGQGIGTITDDDSVLTISVEDVMVSEGQLDYVAIALSQAPEADMYVTWTTTDITADSSDYDPTGGTILFTAETTELIQYVPIATYQDGILEPDEQFSVTAFDEMNNPYSGTVTISDIDESLWITIDAPETVLVGDPFVVSGNASTNATHIELVVDSGVSTWTEDPIYLDSDGNWSMSFDTSYSAVADELIFTAYAFSSIGHSLSAIATTLFVAAQAAPTCNNITVEMTVAAPFTKGIANVAVNRQVHRIRPNIDDDDSDNNADFLQVNNGVTGENDLVYTKVKLNYTFQQLNDANFEVVLRRT